MASSLARIEARLNEFRRDRLLAAFLPSETIRTVRSALEAGGLRSVPDLEDLYAWKGGTDASPAHTVGDIALFPGFYFLSLNDASADYKTFVADPRWRVGWWPVFANGGGDFYVIDVHAGMAIRHFWIDESEHPIEFSSLNAMVKTLAEAYDLGVFYVDPDGYLEMDDDRFAQVAAEMNPDIPWWTDDV